MSDETTVRHGPRRIGKYFVERALGEGAMGVVYLCLDPDIDRRVAVKVIREAGLGPEQLEEFADRFRREAKAAGRLNHPGIVAVYDFGRDDGLSYLAMEYVEGRSLAAAIREDGEWPLERIIQVVEAILSALGHAHEQGVVHRDIKPDNVLLADAGGIKLTDFGIARLEDAGLTRSGAVLGTPYYMAPEQVQGRKVSPATDLYAVGVILYELLAGERPFAGSTTSLGQKILHQMPVRPSLLNVGVPAWLDAVVAKAMAKMPADRFRTAEEFAAALRNPQRDTAGAANPAPGEETVFARSGEALPGGRRGTGQAVRAALAAILLLALGAVGYGAWLGLAPEEEAPPAVAEATAPPVSPPAEAPDADTPAEEPEARLPEPEAAPAEPGAGPAEPEARSVEPPPDNAAATPERQMPAPEPEPSAPEAAASEPPAADEPEPDRRSGIEPREDRQPRRPPETDAPEPDAGGGAGSASAPEDAPERETVAVEPEPNPPAAPADIEASLGLTTGQRVGIQRALAAAGFPVGVADGIFGPRSRAAIRAWQRSIGEAPSGYLTAGQAGRLRQAAAALPPPEPAAPPEAATAPPPEPADPPQAATAPAPARPAENRPAENRDGENRGGEGSDGAGLPDEACIERAAAPASFAIALRRAEASGPRTVARRQCEQQIDAQLVATACESR